MMPCIQHDYTHGQLSIYPPSTEGEQFANPFYTLKNQSALVSAGGKSTSGRSGGSGSSGGMEGSLDTTANPMYNMRGVSQQPAPSVPLVPSSTAMDRPFDRLSDRRFYRPGSEAGGGPAPSPGRGPGGGYQPGGINRSGGAYRSGDPYRAEGVYGSEGPQQQQHQQQHQQHLQQRDMQRRSNTNPMYNRPESIAGGGPAPLAPSPPPSSSSSNNASSNNRDR